MSVPRMNTSVRMRIRSTGKLNGSASRSLALDKQAQAYLAARTTRTKLDRAFADTTAKNGNGKPETTSDRATAQAFNKSDGASPAVEELPEGGSRSGNINGVKTAYRHFRPDTVNGSLKTKAVVQDSEVRAGDATASNKISNLKATPDTPQRNAHLKASLDTPQRQAHQYEGVMDQLRVSADFCLLLACEYASLANYCIHIYALFRPVVPYHNKLSSGSCWRQAQRK